MLQTIELRVRSGKFITKVVTATIEDDGRLYLKFGYNKALLTEIKCFDGRQWHGPIKGQEPHAGYPPKYVSQYLGQKVWSIPTSSRNLFQLSYLKGENPYARYDAPLLDYKTDRPFKDYQYDMASHFWTRRQAILAGDPGIGKTLPAIDVMEKSGFRDWWYVAPLSALYQVEDEFNTWNLNFRPTMYTYNGMTNAIKNWTEGTAPPRGVVFDECQKLKTPTAQRGQAGKNLADEMRKFYGIEAYILLMSGTCAPRNPTDWFWLSEIACPGFLKEGNIHQLRQRLSVCEEAESQAGGVFSQHITWKDDKSKCDVCGLPESDSLHDMKAAELVDYDNVYHHYIPSKNEVALLGQRLKGLVMVKRKKDCLNLPDKIYRKIKLEISDTTKRLSRLITSKCGTAIQALTLLRELSDGFQYKMVATDKLVTCEACNGAKVVRYKEYLPEPFEWDYPTQDEFQEALIKFKDIDEDGFLPEKEFPCELCQSTGKVREIIRTHKQFSSAKLDMTKALLEEYEDIGRFVIYAGFQASVDRCVDLAIKQGWSVIKADGRGWKSFTYDRILIHENPIKLFQRMKEQHPKVCFIGQAGAAGTGLNLTASPAILFYSNSFNGDDRMQAIERIHRLGMDLTLGATIIDLIHLSADETVLDNLNKKKWLHELTLGEIDGG